MPQGHTETSICLTWCYKNIFWYCFLIAAFAPKQISWMTKTTLKQCYPADTTEATEAHFFAQESSSTHRIWVRFHRNWVGRTGFEFVSPGIELGAQDLSSFPQEFLYRWTPILWVELDSCEKRRASVVSVDTAEPLNFYGHYPVMFMKMNK